MLEQQKTSNAETTALREKVRSKTCGSWMYRSYLKEDCSMLQKLIHNIRGALLQIAAS